MGPATASLRDLGQTTLRSLIQPRSDTGNGDEDEDGGENGDSGCGHGTRTLEERSRQAAGWDPAVPGEDVDWYAEYAARHGRVSFGWVTSGAEVKGMGVFHDPQGDGDKVVGPLEDGRVCIWDIRQGDRKMVGSSPKTLSGCEQGLGSLGECVSVDSSRRRAYLAAGSVLNEVDLDTLRVISCSTYPEAVFALSQETDYDAPMTVATAQGIHINDPRASATESASLFQPGPLSVLHPAQNTILVAGRFPSILSYDRRFLRLQGAVHSGGGLCSLATIPARRQCQKVVACGEYKGRGSLELYDLGPEGLATTYRNRQSAASSKLLSVASHGTRIVYADAGGMVKWVERDVRTEVRRWNINAYLAESRSHSRSQVEEGGIFASSTGENEVVRKILPTGGTFIEDAVLVWTGERIGCLSLGSGDEDEEDIVPGNQVEDERLRKEREYSTTMRRALERQADEVRRMGGFGL